MWCCGKSQMPSPAEDFLEKAKSFDYILVTIPDIHGVWQSKTFPARNARLLVEKIPVVCLYSVFGINNEIVMIPKCMEKKFGNIDVQMDLGTLFPLAWLEDGTNAKFAALLGDEGFWDDNSRVPFSTRYIARQLLNELEQLGYEIYSAGEYEFRLFIDPARTEGNKKAYSAAHLLVPGHSSMDMFSPTMVNRYKDFLVHLDSSLIQANVELEYMNTEFGHGMWETPMRPQFGIKAADHSFIFKETVRQCALNRDYRASFMTKPIFGQTGSGCHFNHSLWKKSKEGGDTRTNAFYDESSADKFSEVGKHWVAGLMEHAPALSALCAPTVNCYRRMHTPWAPGKIYWQFDDRCATYRVKTVSASGCYIENRLGTSAANPYLLLAGTVAAGLDGIRRKLLPNTPGSEDRGELPKSLDEALIELDKDAEMKKALGEEFVNAFIQIKRETEMKFLDSIDIKQDKPEDLKKEKEQYFDNV